MPVIARCESTPLFALLHVFLMSTGTFTPAATSRLTCLHFLGYRAVCFAVRLICVHMSDMLYIMHICHVDLDTWPGVVIMTSIPHTWGIAHFNVWLVELQSDKLFGVRTKHYTLIAISITTQSHHMVLLRETVTWH